MYLKENIIISLEYNFFNSNITSNLLTDDKKNTDVLGSHYYNKY